ncbi:DUF1156 domain-containing protein [Deinococcus sp. KNUC1210]|uniref:DUF1156 domain-containing protein n=1 Tax=Deinococcus sp. KNUC1210 TaxID=2917691 RepID=UPI001EF15252|nr:DUF1156 domain-containing protein [Deinococcus sp. KNUC1210]ULH14475.1 DUF1156 domain-containing protein [Deinococcus sp. KNUC1210]
MAYKRLIEHRLPLAEVSTESAREKSIRHGHISTLHIWWARRPLAACRAAVFATLVPDTDENYELVKKIVPWEAVKDGNSSDILEARRKVLEANGGVPPKVLDPFGGGGAIPLEALRLGCEVYSLDLNPVAHIIQKATLEFPQKFGQPNSRPVPEYIFEKDRQAQASSVGKVSAKNKGKATQQGGLGISSSEGEWERAYKQNPLATDVRYWGEWVLEKARAELQEFYPPDEDGKVPVAYLWARTVTCTNPACRAEVPTVRQWWLVQKKKRRLALYPSWNQSQKSVSFQVEEVDEGDDWPSKGTVDGGNVTCPYCNTVISVAIVRQQAKAKTWGQKQIATVTLNSGTKASKSYRVPSSEELALGEQVAERFAEATLQRRQYSSLPDEPMLGWRREIRPPIYGIESWGEIFNPRQSLALVTYSNAIYACNQHTIEIGLDKDYCQVITTYLSLAFDKVADYGSSLCRWGNDDEGVTNTFGRQAIPMVWDYAETNPIGSLTGSYGWALEFVLTGIKNTSKSSKNIATTLRGSATKIPLEDEYIDAIVTDPPYYDAISYAELSDFFYVWMKRNIGYLYPEHFRTPLTPKAQEAVQNPSRHDDNNDEAKKFFENSMANAFKEMHRVLKKSGEATIVFAHKSTEAWETLIYALIVAGFVVESSWPVKTEMRTKLSANEGRTMLASSTFINCTKRTSGSIGYFQDVRRDMVDAIRPQLVEFWDSGIRGADFFMSAIGPGLESYSKHDEVRRVSGEAVKVGEFLDEVRKIVMEFALEQVLGAKSLGAVDAATQFGLLSLWGYGSELPSDEARKLAQSVGIELSGLEGLVKVSGDKAKVLSLKERAKNKNLGLSRNGEAVSMIDAMHKSVALLQGGSRQAVSDYLSDHDFLNSEAYWQTMQALAEVQDGADDGRALHELLTIRDNLPKPGDTAAQTLLGAN